MTNSNESSGKKTKRWHQKWWGAVFLLVVAILVLYIGVYIYQVVYYVDFQRQAHMQSFAAVNNPTTGLNTNSSVINQESVRRGLIETSDDPSWGLADAKIVIVEFSDFQCPYCEEFFPIEVKLKQEYGNTIKFIYRDFPNINSHPDALNAALAANCALDQNKFWLYHDSLFTSQANLSATNLKALAVQAGLDADVFNQCFDSQKYLSEVQADLQDGLNLGVTGTPTFFINGYKVAGVVPYDTFKLIIDKMKILTANQPQENLNSNTNSILNINK